jgi:hypothetical protein
MNKQRKTSHILNVFQYDADGHVVLPASLTLGIVPGAEDNSGKVPSTAWVRGLLTTRSSTLVPTNRTITINGLTYDLSSNPSFSIDTGVLTASSGVGISVSVSNQNLNIVNTGLLTASSGAGITVSTSNQNVNIVNTGLLTASSGAGITVTTSNQNVNIVNTGLLTATAGSGITVTTSNQNVNIVNNGILTATAGAGISVSTSNGNLNIVNTITNNNQLDNGAGYATTSYVTTQINNLVAGAPGLLDTLDELAAALGDDANFATTITTSISTKQAQLNGTGFVKVTGTTVSYDNSTYLTTGTAASTYVSLTGSYSNPSWITALGWGKITGTPTTISGYGITNAYTDAQIQNFFNGANAISGYNKSNWDTAFGWGNHASAGYLTTSSAASTYVSLTGSYANPSWITSLAYSKITGVPAFLTSYTETDTLNSVTGRGNTTSNSVRFGSTVDLLPTGSAFRFYDGTTFRGGFGLDSWGHGGSDANLVLYVNGDNTLFFSTSGTKRASLSSAAFNSLVAIQQNGNQVWHAGNLTNLNQLTNGPGYITGYSETDTLASVTGRGASTSTAVTFSTNATIGRVLIDFDGTDTWFRMQSGNRMRITTTGGTDFIIPNTGNMTYNGNTVWHSGNLTNLNQLTNSPGYITTARDWFGAMTTSGTADWNHVTNTRPGTGYTLLLGTHSNGPGPSEYFHPFNLEYSSKDGTGNVTQMAISYGSPGNKIYIRGRYDGSWNGWNQIVTNSGTWGISITGNAATLGGYSPNQTGGAYNIVQRDANGYIQNSYFYMSGGGSERNSSGLGYIAGFNSSDYYVRSYNSTAVASFLGLGSMAYASTGSYLPFSGGTMSGTPVFTAAWGNAGGDYTGITNPAYKVDVTSGYWRVVYKGGHSSVSGVYNFESGKNVYWGEPTDTGDYIFRGRTMKWAASNGTEYILLHANNYNSYSPTLTGSGASGTWGIRITGFANQGSARLYSTDSAYNYDAANPYFGYLTYDGTRWLFQVSPGTPAAVRVAYSDSSGSASTASQVSINYNNDSNANYQLLWGSGNSVYGTGNIYVNPSSDTIYATSYRGSSNVGGTGEATHHPAGIYSQGTNWLYGTMYLNVNSINDTADIRTYNSSYHFRARYTSGSDIYHASLNWYGLQLGNNGENYIIGGRTNTGGSLVFYVNNTSDFTSVNGVFAAKMHSTGRTSFGQNSDNGYQVQVYGSLYTSDWLRVGGSQGLYFESYGGGWRMTDSSYIRSYNGKALSMEGASVDYVSSIYMNGGVYISTNNNRNLQVKSSGAADCGILGRGNGDQFAFQIYGSGGDYGFLDGAWAAWDIRKTVDGAMYMNDNNSYYLQTNSLSRLYSGQFDYIGVGQAINTGYRIITSGDIYLNAQGNGWAEGVWKQRRSGGTFYDVIDAGNIGSQSVNFANYSDRIQTGNNQWNWSNGAHTATNANTVTLWDQYSSNGGSGYPTVYGTILDIYGRVAHEHDQLYFSYDGQLLHRNCFYGTNSWSSWRTIITSANISSQSVSYASSAGSVAWGNVSGRPTAVSSFSNDSGYVTSGGEINRTYRGIIQDTRGGQRTPNDYDDYRVSWEFTNQIVSGWHSVMTLQGWHDGYAAWQIIGPSDSAHENWYLRSGNNTSWNSLRNIIHSGNFTSYVNAPNAVGNGSGYYNVQNWLQVNGSHGIFWPGYYSFHIRPNISSTYTQMEIIGSKNSYGGIYDNYSAVNGMMYDGGGNGGVYREANGRWYWYHHLGNNCTGISTSSTSSSYRAYIGGALYAEGDIVAYSDVRKKTDIVTIDNALEKVINLRGVYYTRIDDAARGRQTGVIAQEINEVLPEVVTYAADVDEYGVSYGNIVGVLIEAIKEQQLQIEKLQNKLDNVLSSR